MSIALNSISKYKARVLPSVKDYLSIKGVLPRYPLFSLAALIKFYGGKRNDEIIALKDDPTYLEFFSNLYSSAKDNEEIVTSVLTNVNFWGEDLTKISNLKEIVLTYYNEITAKGMNQALKDFVGD